MRPISEQARFPEFQQAPDNVVVGVAFRLPTQTSREFYFLTAPCFGVTYKGRTYTAEVKDGVWVGADGQTRASPSEAAVKITGNSVNGWRFWQCKRPGDLG